MKLASIVSALCAGFAVTSATAQPFVNLTGQYQCVQGCATGPGGLAYVTQNGSSLNLTNEAGLGSRAWVDWPGHIWVQSANEGAVYSPDGITIQFDHGTVWQRVIAPPPVLRRRG